MADIDGNLIELRDTSSSPTIFKGNINPQFSPRGLGNNPISIVPGGYSNNAERFYENEDALYDDGADYNEGAPWYSFGPQQPYVKVNPGDSEFRKYIKKYDSRMFPIGSSIQDVERITKFTFSGYGVKFLLLQQALHFQAPFDEANINDPTSHLVSTARSAGLGSIPRVTKHTTGGSLLGSVISAFGGPQIGEPKSTVDVSGLDVLPNGGRVGSDEHYGLIRGNTAASGYNRISQKWGTTSGGGSGGLLATLKQRFLPSVGAGQPNTSKFRADEDVYNLMIGESSKKGTSKLTLGGQIPYITTVNPFVSEDRVVQYIAPDDIPYGQDRKNLDGTYSNILNDLNSTEDKNSRLTGFRQSYANGITPTTTAPQSKFVNQSEIKENIDRLKNIGVNSTIDPITQDKGVNSVLNGYESTVDDHREYYYNLTKLNTNTPKIENVTIVETSDELKRLRDFIKFNFFDVVNEKYLPFRATLKSINNNTTAEWADMRYVGRADKVYSYNGFTRDLSFNFRVYASSIDELIPMWAKINYLNTLTYPSNTTEFNNYSVNLPPFVKLTIGDLYNMQPLILKSISVSVPDESSWEVGPPPGWSPDDDDSGNPYKQLPFLAEISVSATLLEKELPRTGVSIYGSEFDFRLAGETLKSTVNTTD